MSMEDPQAALDVAVTVAIDRAERLPADSSEARAAYAEVSSIEEALAALHPAMSVEGAVARVGAITAALRASQWARAEALAQRYLSDAQLAAARRAQIEEAFRTMTPQPVADLTSLRRHRMSVRSRFQEAA